MAKYTMKYGDLIDGGIIAAADLPAAWVNFPALKYPQPVGDVSFIDLFYKRYQNREISGDTVPTFLMFLESTTAEAMDISILPYEDCCTVFTPKHPQTKPTMEKVLEEESKLDVEALIAEALEGVERVTLG